MEGTLLGSRSIRNQPKKPTTFNDAPDRSLGMCVETLAPDPQKLVEIDLPAGPRC